MTPTKYKRNKTETKIEFVTRIVVSENKPMTASDVVAHIDKRSMKGVSAKNIHANLSDAVSKYDTLCKKRMENEQGQKRVHYYPCDMDVAGEDIPVPAYTKEGGNTFTNLPADGPQVPPAVAVAEKVLADYGESDDKPAKREPVVQRVDIGTGWVKMVDGMPEEFTPNALTSIADAFNATPEATVKMLVRHLKTRPIDWNQDTQRVCYFIKEVLIESYGRSAHRRQ